MNDPRTTEGLAGEGTGVIGRLTSLALARRPGHPSRHDRILRELAPACDSIERADFLSGVKVEPFLQLAEGARRG